VLDFLVWSSDFSAALMYFVGALLAAGFGICFLLLEK